MKHLPVAIAVIAALLAPQCSAEKSRVVDLPEPTLKGMSVEEAIMLRRSERSYTEDSLSLDELSQILFSGQGITASRGGFNLRAAPSAGATYPLELYVFVNRVETLKPGMYHYRPEDHSIEAVREGNLGEDLAAACLGQTMPATAACSVVMTAVPARTTKKYGERGINYIYMEAGHVSENIYLECTSLGLGVVGIGAFYDEELDNLIGIDGEREMSVFVNSIGRTPPERGEQD
jgi:SagB-type dehydrogenase family enzyme